MKGTDMKSDTKATILQISLAVMIFTMTAVSLTPVLKGTADASKWNHAQGQAELLAGAVTAYIDQQGQQADAELLSSNAAQLAELLGLDARSFGRPWFNAEDFTVTDISIDPPACQILIRGTNMNSPEGVGIYSADDNWQVIKY